MDTPKSAERKPRGDSNLKELGPELQQELYFYMEGVGKEKGHTYKQCVAWLAPQGVKTTKSQLSNWRSWYWMRLLFQECGETTEAIVEDEQKGGAKLTDEQIERKGNRTFNLLAIKTRNDKMWASQQTLAVRKQAVAATERKVELEIKKYEDQRAKTREVESDPELTADEKQERIRQILGTD
jgi:hypothetical protein